jgi:hypothetical protein
MGFDNKKIGEKATLAGSIALTGRDADTALRRGLRRYQ